MALYIKCNKLEHLLPLTQQMFVCWVGVREDQACLWATENLPVMEALPLSPSPVPPATLSHLWCYLQEEKGENGGEVCYRLEFSQPELEGG